MSSIKRRIPLTVAACLLTATLTAADAVSMQKLLGTWHFAATNTQPDLGVQTTHLATTYKADGSFSMEGVVSVIYPTNKMARTTAPQPGPTAKQESFTKKIAGTGSWRFEQGCIFSQVTNSASIRTNVEHRLEIVTVTATNLTYRLSAGQGQGQLRTVTRHP